MSLAIVIPTYNEAGNIEALLSVILSLKLDSAVIYIIDDNSPDSTGVIADNFAKKNRGIVRVIHRRAKLGLGSAYKEGFKRALIRKPEIIVTMDADFSHDPQVIPEMLDKLEKGDVVIGSRHIAGGKIVGFNSFRHTLSRGAQFLSMKVLGLAVHDSTSAFRAYKTQALESVNPQTIKSEGYSFLIELIYRCQKKGYKIIETPIIYINRTKGVSKISQAEILKALFSIIRMKIGG